MPHLFVPPSVARELLDERRQFAACLENACYSDAVCERWDKELQRLDPRLKLRRAPEYLVIGMPLVPGHYHLIRDNENAPPSVTPVRGPNGEFIEPPGDLLERLKKMDLWDARVTAMRKLEQAREEIRAEKEKLNAREERQDLILEHVAATSRTQVSMNDSVPWAQNADGFRRVKKNPRKRPGG